MLEIAGGILIAVMALAIGLPLVIMCLPYIIMCVLFVTLYVLCFLVCAVIIFVLDKNGNILNSEWGTVILFGSPLLICVGCVFIEVASNIWPTSPLFSVVDHKEKKNGVFWKRRSGS